MLLPWSNPYTKMKKLTWILTYLFLLACTSEDKKPKRGIIYDELALKNFVLSTRASDREKSLKKLDSVLLYAEDDSLVFSKTMEYLEVPLGSPNSSHRNDTLYFCLLQFKTQSKWIDSTVKKIAVQRKMMIIRNKPGTFASEFVYITPAGDKKNLSDLRVKYTLLYFYNPECHACIEMRSALASSKVISQQIEKKDLKVLTIYIDRDEQVWLDHLKEIPDTWINGRDIDEYLHKNSVYDLRAIPTVYLLARDKTVLLKDVMDVREIEEAVGR